MRNKLKNDKTVWHYTYSHNIGAILESKVLLPPYLTPGFRMQEASAVAQFGESILKDRGFVADKKLLLFSQREDWEPMSYRAVMTPLGPIDLHGIEDYSKYGMDVFRIAVSVSILHPYLKLKRLAGMPKDMAANLDRIAGQFGSNPYDWWGTMKPVGIDKWTAIQVRNPESKAWETFAEIEVEKVEIPLEVNSPKANLKL